MLNVYNVRVADIVEMVGCGRILILEVKKNYGQEAVDVIKTQEDPGLESVRPIA